MSKNSTITAKRLVVNASPLICLFGAELEGVLRGTSTEVVVPEAVWTEVMESSQKDRASAMVPRLSWINQIEVPDLDRRVANWDLGAGETEVLTETLHSEGSLAVIDDADARRCAKSLGIGFMGTGGLLLVGKKVGLVQSVTDCLDALSAAGLWISDEVMSLLQKKAGE